MKTPYRITALVGSYRKGGAVDSAVDEILDAAKTGGAEVHKIFLLDRHIEFCRNCRQCTQAMGEQRGVCVHEDEMSEILDEIDRSDALVIASPMNFGTVTAVMKRFMERLVCKAYWPWGSRIPKVRKAAREKVAVVVGSSAMPAIMARLLTQIVRLLKECASVLGARTVGVLFIGMVAQHRRPKLSARVQQKARALGEKLLNARP